MPFVTEFTRFRVGHDDEAVLLEYARSDGKKLTIFLDLAEARSLASGLNIAADLMIGKGPTE